MGTIHEDLAAHNQWDIEREQAVTDLTADNESLATQVVDLQSSLDISNDAVETLNQQNDILSLRVLDLQAQLADCESEEPPQQRAFPLIFGAAVDNSQTVINDRQSKWGPIRMSRDYEAQNGVVHVSQYPWWTSVVRQLADPTDDNFKYVAFSVDNPWDQTASGTDKGQWETLLNSLTTHLPGVKGFISIGNEVNIEGAEADRAALATKYRAAVEKLIDTFGYEPVPGWCWGTSFSNFASWGQGRSEGERWLPRREDGLFAVSTHVYGKSEYTDPALMIGRTFIPAMKRRPNWIWGIGETSAQEDAGHVLKAEWFTDLFDLVRAEGGSWFLPFDTNVGGSADVGTSPQTIAAVKALAESVKDNHWIF